MRNARISLAIILMVTGFIVVFSYQYFKKDQDKEQLSKLTTEQWNQERKLREELINEQENNRALQKRINNEMQQIQSVEKRLAAQKDNAALLAKRLNNYRMINGVIAVHGPGIKVTLKDANYVPNGDDPNSYIVHQQDLQEVIYELYSAGAEAISLNGIRLTAHSYIQCVGPVVKIDGQKKTAPFTVEAIGNSKILMTSMNMSGGTVDLLISRGINISVEQKADIELKPVL